jgi:hypothetical protein
VVFELTGGGRSGILGLRDGARYRFYEAGREFDGAIDQGAGIEKEGKGHCREEKKRSHGGIYRYGVLKVNDPDASVLTLRI